MDIPSENLEYEMQCPCCLNKKDSNPPIESTAAGLIDDIMKKYFCSKAGQGSSCSLFTIPKVSTYSVDKRLDYWSKILEDRKRIACRIQRVTGKRISHVLYNQTEEHRNVQNVKRVIDIAQRLNPTNISKRKTYAIKQTIFETLPRTERVRAPDFEIVGTPRTAMAEQWLCSYRDGKNSFIRSSYLQRKLKSSTVSGKIPLDFYPDLDQLEVIGRRIHKHPKQFAELDSDFQLSLISSTTDSCQNQEFPEVCMQINDTVLRGDKKLARDMVFYMDFKCIPNQRQKQTACRIKNIGKKAVYLHVRRIKPQGSAYLPPFRKTFHFNVNSIRLGYGESIDIEVTFHSDERRVQEDIYYLLTEPSFFEDTYQILFKLTGDCYIPKNYFNSLIGDLLDSVIKEVVAGTAYDSAKRKEVLTDKEMFELQNPGFKCEPQDLKKFYQIYRQVKRKYHPTKWSMNLQGLKELIEGVEDYTQRAVYLAEFRNTICEMRRRAPSTDSNINVLLARTVIVANLDKWESKARQIHHAVATMDLDLLIIKMPFETIMEQIKLCKTEKGKRRIILHNALYIQMFCSLCEVAEDIVSYVENCHNMDVF